MPFVPPSSLDNPPVGAAGGDLSGTYPNPALAAIGAAAGPTGDATHTPVVTIDTKGRVTALTSAAISSSPSGAAGGDLTGTYPNPTLAAAGGGAAGPFGDTTHAPTVTVDAKGRVTALTNNAIAFPAAPVTSVFTRTGAVVAASGDYTAAQVSALADTSTLNSIATAHATTADISMNSHKLTNLTNGASAQDAAAFGQIPTALPPNGSAGGDLTGTYPNPSVATGILGGAAWTTVRKGSDTGRNTTTTVAIDPALQFTATNGTLYEVELIIIYVSTAGAGTPDFKEGVGEDGTARGTEFHFGASASDVAASAIGLSRTTDNATWGTAATIRGVSIKGFHVGAGGTFGLFWAQGTSNGNDTTVKAGSVLRYRAIS